MFPCRVAWQTLAPRFSRTLPLLRGHVPSRQMSHGGVPGSSGGNMIYYLFVLGAGTVAGFFAYRTVKSDHSRYLERIEDIEKSKGTVEWKSKPWPPSSSSDDEIEATEGPDKCEEAKDVVEKNEAVVADESHTQAVIADGSQVQKEVPTETTGPQEEGKSAVEEQSSSVQEEEQNATDTLEEAQAKG